MPYINNSQELAAFLSEIRKDSNITISDLAKQIEKSSGYISNVENFKTNKIDVGTFNKLLRIFSARKENQSKIDSFLSDGLPLNFTDEENQSNQNMLRFDSQYRQIAIPQSFVDYINNTLAENNISTEAIMIELNSNRSVEDSERFNKNELIFTEDRESNAVDFTFVFDLKLDFLQKILDRTITKCCYINLKGIVYAVNLLLGCSVEEAQIQSDIILRENKIYTLPELRKIRAEERIGAFAYEAKDGTQLPPEYVEYYGVLKKLISFLNFLKDKDTEYTTSKLTTLLKNLTCPSTSNITLGFMGLPLMELSVVPIEKQIEIFTQCKEIILKATQEKNSDVIDIKRIE